MQFVRNHQSITVHTALTCINYILNIYRAWFSSQNLILTAYIPPLNVLSFEAMSFLGASRHLMKRPADCAGGSASFINKTSYRSRFKPLQHVDSDVPRAWGTHESAGAPVCFSRLRASLRIPGRSGAQQRRKEASKLSLDFSCQWLRRGGLLRFAPSLLSNAETDDPEEVEGGGGKSLLVGVFAPVWT